MVRTPRSPPNLRARQPSQVRQPRRTLSVDSEPTDKDTGNVNMDKAAIEACLTELLSSNKLIDKLVSRMTTRLETIVAEATTKSITAVLDRVSELEKQVTTLQDKVKSLDTALNLRSDDLEQYQRRNNLRVFGIPETNGEDTDKLVTKLFKEKLGVDVPVSRLDRSHRVGKKLGPKPGETARPRPIIVRFTSYQDRRLVFTAKKKLKSTGYSIREDLTSTRVQLLQMAAERFGKDRAWTLDGRILWIDQHGVKGVASHLADFPK